MKVIIVDTSGYTSWDGVKALYVDVYEALISDVLIDGDTLETYQTSLDALKKTGT